MPSMPDDAPWAKYQTATTTEGPWTKYGPQVDHTTPPPPSPHTTAAGVVGAATRGVAPYAAGAAIGAIGGPLGAAAGAGAVGLTQIATGLYNAVADKMGWPKTATPQEMTDKLLDVAGVKRPETGIERMVETTAGGAAGGLTGAGAANVVAERAAGPVTRAVAERMAEKPVLQAVSGASGGAAAQGAAERGMSPGWQMAAGFLGSLAPYPMAGVRALSAIDPKVAAREAINAGYSLPPAEATQGSIGKSLLPNMLAGFSGKVKTRQYASAVNQPVTNKLAASDLGLPPDTPLTPETFEGVRKEAGKAYGVLKSVPIITLDDEFRNSVESIGAEANAASKEFPEIIDVSGVDKIRKELLDAPQRPTSALVEVVKRLRFDAKANLQARADPDKLVLGLAQRQAASVVDDLIERNLAATGDERLVNQYKAARTQIAKSYDYESATNVSTNDVDARHIAGLYDKGRPMTGNMKVIADAANNFPQSFQSAAKLGGVEEFSVLDMAYAAAAFSAAAARGDFGLAAGLAAGIPFARPAVRAGIMSPGFQRAMVNPQPNAVPLPILAQPGLWNVQQPNPLQDLGISQGASP